MDEQVKQELERMGISPPKYKIEFQPGPNGLGVTVRHRSYPGAICGIVGGGGVEGGYWTARLSRDHAWQHFLYLPVAVVFVGTGDTALCDHLEDRLFQLQEAVEEANAAANRLPVRVAGETVWVGCDE